MTEEGTGRGKAFVRGGSSVPLEAGELSEPEPLGSPARTALLPPSDVEVLPLTVICSFAAYHLFYLPTPHSLKRRRGGHAVLCGNSKAFISYCAQTLFTPQVETMW